MNVQRWRHQHQHGSVFRKLAIGKVSEFLKFVSCLMPLHSCPVIQALQWQMDILLRFQLNHGKLACASYAEYVNHRPIGGGKRRNLRIHLRGIEIAIDRGHILQD